MNKSQHEGSDNIKYLFCIENEKIFSSLNSVIINFSLGDTDF